MPSAALLALPFDESLLLMMICFLGAIDTREEAFCGRLWVGLEGDLEYGLRSHKSISLLWIKISLPWIKPTTSDLRRPPDSTCLSTHEKIHLSGLEHRCVAGLRPSGVRINRWNGMK